ncbi:uncharacterized protein LOC144144350 [Haemaphysalis longicornis]
MSLKLVLVLALVSVYSEATSGSFKNAAAGCLPSLPCRCPCELGLEYPSGCGICVCPPVCPVCSSSCYYPPSSSGSCPRCAPASYCYGSVGKK